MLASFKKWRYADDDRSRIDLVLFWLAWLLHIPLLLYLPINLMDGEPRNIIGNIAAIVISFIPRWMESRSPYHFPALGEFSISAAMLIELTGRTFHLYERGGPLPFDVFSHTAISAVMVMFFVMLVYAFLFEHDVEYDSMVIIVIGALIGLGLGGLWELYEWSADSFVGASFQSGNGDTMRDLVADVVGAVIGSILGRAYRRSHSREQIMDEIPIFYYWL